MAFLDFKKAFPSVWREGLWEKMKEYVIDGKFLRVCQNLYCDVGARVRVGKVFSERYTIEEGFSFVEVTLDFFAPCLPNPKCSNVAAGVLKTASIDGISLAWSNFHPRECRAARVRARALVSGVRARPRADHAMIVILLVTIVARIRLLLQLHSIFRLCNHMMEQSSGQHM